MLAHDPGSRRLRQGDMLALLWNVVFHGTSARSPGTVYVSARGRTSLCNRFSAYAYLLHTFLVSRVLHDGRALILYFLWQVGDDKTVKQWSMEGPGYGLKEEPLTTILGKV